MLLYFYKFVKKLIVDKLLITMAKVSNLDIDPALEDSMLKSVKIQNKLYDESIIVRKIAVGAREYKQFKGMSYMKFVASIWNDLIEEERQNWSDTAENCNLSGWQLFLQELSYRIKNNFAGLPTLSEFHQYKILEAYIPPDNEDFFISQPHYVTYKKSTKNTGQKNARTFVDIEEEMTSPFLFEFSYKADLTETDLTNEFYIEISFFGTKDGAPDGETEKINLTKQTDWIRFSEEIESDLDTITTYEVSIMGKNVTGTIQLDNFNFYHDSVNYAFDPTCKDLLKYWYFILSSYVQSWQWDIAGRGSYFINKYIS